MQGQPLMRAGIWEMLVVENDIQVVGLRAVKMMWDAAPTTEGSEEDERLMACRLQQRR